MGIMDILALNGKTPLQNIADSFAFDLSKRISGKNLADIQANSDQQADKADGNGEEKQGQLHKLEQSLSSTVAYMAESHGEKAASAMIAIVYKRLGADEINEESLGNAFLDVTHFIDANFGTDKGDAFMAHLNGNLNQAMNEFFDNGLNETFMVAPASYTAGTQTLPGADLHEQLEDIARDYTENVLSMLEEARVKQPAYAKAWQQPMLQGVLLSAVA
ncbi:MAG: hypothetical protein LBV76_05660 [Deltaproteobacteria bacterium]|jgi:hypothetical protein|nr:hypothetical protein [Deltaproteobacteria bacterium]